jgi:hypothetical protein
MRFFAVRSQSGGFRRQVFQSVTTLTASSRTTIMAVLDDVRHRLQEAEATALGTAPSIHEAGDFNSDQPNLGYLCEQVVELTNGVAAKLLVASRASNS